MKIRPINKQSRARDDVNALIEEDKRGWTRHQPFFQQKKRKCIEMCGSFINIEKGRKKMTNNERKDISNGQNVEKNASRKPFIQEIQQQKEEERTGCEQLLTG